MGRDLMTPDEVRMLDNQYAILVIRGEPPIKDLKYDLMKHPNIGLTADGGAEPYVHGEAKDAKNTISLTSDLLEELSDEELAAALQGIAGTVAEQGEAAAQEDEISYVLLSEEDIEKEYANQQ